MRNAEERTQLVINAITDANRESDALDEDARREAETEKARAEEANRRLDERERKAEELTERLRRRFLDKHGGDEG
jgi:hypothetical protein